MSHAPWYYGWWVISPMHQAHLLLIETVVLTLGYTALALWAVRLRRLRDLGDPAERMLEDDPQDEP